MKYLLLFLCMLSISNGLNSANKQDVRLGHIKGKVLEADTRTPLPGVTIVCNHTPRSTITDEQGRFAFLDMPVGSYALTFSYPDFSPLVKTDIIVKSRDTTVVEAEMQMHLLEQITVTSGYFPRKKEQPVSVTGFSYEELRRSAGSAGDISRMVGILPSVSRVNDQWNGLIVRGGCPSENGFYIDNIQIPDINHFSMRGSTGGPIGILNVDFIRDVHFYSGGFSALFGDRLSSIMDIDFREGNREHFNLQMELNMAGIGAVGEGPLAGGKGSWLFSARKSYLDWLVDAIGVGTAPRFGDLQGKFTYDFSDRVKLTLITVTGVDKISFTKDNANDMGMDLFGDYDSWVNTAGLNLRAVWKNNGYSDISLTHNYREFKSGFFDLVSDAERYSDSTSEQSLKLRNVNQLRLGRGLRLQFGGEVTYIVNDYNYFVGEYVDIVGHNIPAFYTDTTTSAWKTGLFSNLSWPLFPRLTLNLGLRGDYFSYNGRFTFSPRFSLAYRVAGGTTLNASFGVFRQNMPLELLVTLDNGKELRDPLAYHYIFGINQDIGKGTQLTLELYRKDYRNFPMDVDQPLLFLSDEFFVAGYQRHQRVVDSGRARSSGVELTLQKKMARRIYGILCMSYFRTRYLGLDGEWRNRVYDNRYIFSVEGGWKPNKKWEFSLRWTYAGGVPYTPFDLEVSQLVNSGVLDVGQVNEGRNPDYHSLKVRADRRYYFRKSNLTVYLNVWNVYNRRNIGTRFWNKVDRKADVSYQWSLIPVLGLEFEF